MLGMIKKLAETRKKDPDFYDATRFVQERVDLFYEENNSNILRADTEHNETGRKLSGNLITYATVIIGLVTLIMGQKDLLNSLSGYQKGFLLAGLVFLFSSLVGGALEHWDAMQHYKSVASLYSRANKEAPLNTAETMKDLHVFRNELFKDYKRTSRSRGLITQFVSLGVGAILYFVLFTTILFR
jgi:hypothetical protein